MCAESYTMFAEVWLSRGELVANLRIENQCYVGTVLIGEHLFPH